MGLAKSHNNLSNTPALDRPHFIESIGDKFAELGLLPRSGTLSLT